MKLFRSIAIATAAVAFAIAVLGSWIRINGDGMTCPDWPLCHGRIIPTLAGGIVLEWSHRAAAFVESWLVVATIVLGIRVSRGIAGLRAGLWALGGLFGVQVLLGGATVRLANSPVSVALHWGAGMALLGTLVCVAALAVLAPSPARPRPVGDPAVPWLAAASLAAFATMCLGAYVSSSFAGLACSTIPACDGTLLGTTPAQVAQMLHRGAGGLFAMVAAVAAAVAWRRSSHRVRAFAAFGLALVALQIVLGLANVVLALPDGLREAHAANAAVTFVAFALATILAAFDGRRDAVRTTPARGSERRLGTTASEAS